VSLVSERKKNSDSLRKTHDGGDVGKVGTCEAEDAKVKERQKRGNKEKESIESVPA
jgi:hypothetical protein